MPANTEIRAMIERLAHNGPYSREWHVCMIEAAAMLGELLAEREWRDMDSAPRDGTSILGYKSVKEPFICEWRDDKGGQWFSQLMPGFWHENVEKWLPLPTPETVEQ